MQISLVAPFIRLPLPWMEAGTGGIGKAGRTGQGRAGAVQLSNYLKTLALIHTA